MVIVSKTKNVAVYNKLRQSIIKGKLKPGQKVVMAELAKAFWLSETPVREAIRRLEGEEYTNAWQALRKRRKKHGFWNCRKKSHCRGCERRIG